MIPKRYIIQAFDDNEAAENFINDKDTQGYECVSISDTNRCITVLLKRKLSAAWYSAAENGLQKLREASDAGLP